jgi:hypothetical protein
VTEMDPVDEALGLARGELSAPDAVVERVWQRVTPGVVPPAAPSGWAALKATGASGVVAAALLAGGGFALGFLARGESSVKQVTVGPPLTPQVVVQPAPAEARAPSATSGVPAVVVADDSVARPSARAPARRATKPSSDDAQQELVLLQRVERALRNEDAALALVLLAELEQRFPRTALGEERRAARLMSHCIQEERGAAEAARTFLSRHPASVYQNRLRSLCKITAGEVDDSRTGTPGPDTDGR